MAIDGFCSLLNIGGISSQIILKANTDTLISRRKFLTDLARELALPQMRRRSTLQNLSIPLRHKIHAVVGTEAPAHQQEVAPKTQCVYCPKRKNGFSQARCGTVCKEHTASTVLTCFQCAAPNPQDDD